MAATSVHATAHNTIRRPVYEKGRRHEISMCLPMNSHQTLPSRLDSDGLDQWHANICDYLYSLTHSAGRSLLIKYPIKQIVRNSSLWQSHGHLGAFRNRSPVRR